MLAFLSFSTGELIAIGIVAILVFGRNLPEVAGQVAGTVQKLRRSLSDLRRETGIDREIFDAQRSVRSSLNKATGGRGLRQAVKERLLERAGLDEETREEVGEAGSLSTDGGEPVPDGLPYDTAVETRTTRPDEDSTESEGIESGSEGGGEEEPATGEAGAPQDEGDPTEKRG